MDIQVEVPAVGYHDLARSTAAEPSEEVRRRVAAARQTQARCLTRTRISCNAQMSGRHPTRFS